MDKYKFIIFTPCYTDTSGGTIVLHKLCSMLFDQGHEATIWPFPKPHISEIASLKGLQKLFRWYRMSLSWTLKRSLTIRSPYNPYNLPLARNRDLNKAIVIYPEIVMGNPLRAKKVVRWLLNKPGAMTGEFDFGNRDLFFYFHQHFNDWDLNPDKRNHLRVIELMSDVYKNINKGERSDTCYMVRKGGNRALDQQDGSAIKVDGLSHREMADVFNRCKYFVSYDPHTMYSRYAAMCGCIPIVIPEPGITKEQWRPEIENRYGIAYGWDDIPWAINTRERLFEHLNASEAAGRKSVENFIEISRAYFAKAPSTLNGADSLHKIV